MCLGGGSPRATQKQLLDKYAPALNGVTPVPPVSQPRGLLDVPSFEPGLLGENSNAAAKPESLLSVGNAAASQAAGAAEPLTSLLLGLIGAAGESSRAGVQRNTVPQEWRDILSRKDRELGLPPGFSERMIESESSFRNVDNPQSGAMGMTQVMPNTLSELQRRLGKPLNPHDPVQALDEIYGNVMADKLRAQRGNLVR